jgi:hypothetical protein
MLLFSVLNMSIFGHRVEIKDSNILIITFNLPEGPNELLPHWPSYLQGHIKYDRIDVLRYRVTIERVGELKAYTMHAIVRHVVNAVRNVIKHWKKENNKKNNDNWYYFKSGFCLGLVPGLFISWCVTHLHPQ